MTETRNRFRGMARLLSLAGPAAKGVITAGIIATSASSPAPAETGLRISIYVYNVAKVPEKVLKGAEDSAAKVFAKAGIRTTWLEPRISIPEDLEPAKREDPWIPTNIALRIYMWPMIKELQLNEEAMGFVWKFETHSAGILYDRVQNLAVSKRIEVAPILGIAMAHEMGHLLLRSREHSSEGIMRPYWSYTNLQSAAQSGLSFTAEQARRMRDEVLRWSAQPPETGLKMEGDTYNYSAVSAETLARAEQEVVGNPALPLPDAITRLTLRLLTNSVADAFQNLPVRLANDLETPTPTTDSNLAPYNLSARQRDPEAPSITVRTYNLANAPTEDLAQANYAAGQIFKQAGIEVRWLNCALSLQEARTNTACEEATGRHDFDVAVSTASITRPGIATDTSLDS